MTEKRDVSHDTNSRDGIEATPGEDRLMGNTAMPLIEPSVLTQFNALYGDMEDGVYLVDPHQPLQPRVACNDAFLRLHKMTRAQALGSAPLHVNTQEAGTYGIEALSEVARLERLKRNGREIIYANFELPDGTYLSLECITELITLSGHEYIITRDRLITEESEETSQKEQNEKTIFQEFFHYLLDGALLIDLSVPECPVVDCNSRYLTMSGYRREQVIGVTAPDLSLAQDPERYRGVLPTMPAYFNGQLLNNRVIYDGRHRRSDGTFGTVRILQYSVTIDGRRLALTILHDNAEEQRRNTLDLDRNNVLELIARDAPLEESLRSLALLLEHQIESSLCGIFLFRGGRLFNGGAPNLPGQSLLPAEGVEAMLAYGPLSEVANRHEAVIVENLPSTSPVRRRTMAAPSNSQSQWTFPILGGNDLLGVITVYNETSRRPTADEVSMINLASRLAVIAIEQRQLVDRLAHQAEHDVLTGLPNRFLFEDRLRQALIFARRNYTRTALFFLDLDGFKTINDTHGHHCGDRVLQEVARRLQTCVRASDTVARLGGDEFTLLISELMQSSDVEIIAHKIIAALEEPISVEGLQVQITTSIGIAIAPDHLPSETFQVGGDEDEYLEQMMRLADHAMYSAKQSGKNRFYCHNQSSKT